jgi:hypothetical protein
MIADRASIETHIKRLGRLYKDEVRP